LQPNQPQNLQLKSHTTTAAKKAPAKAPAKKLQQTSRQNL